MQLNAFLKSILRTALLSLLLASMYLLRACTAISAPLGVPTPNWCGWNRAAQVSFSLAMATFPASRRRVNPIAIGLTPSSDLDKAISCAP